MCKLDKNSQTKVFKGMGEGTILGICRGFAQFLNLSCLPTDLHDSSCKTLPFRLSPHRDWNLPVQFHPWIKQLILNYHTSLDWKPSSLITLHPLDSSNTITLQLQLRRLDCKHVMEHLLRTPVYPT